MMSKQKVWTRAKLLIALGAAFLATPVWAANQARPGSVNYVEGRVMIDGQSLNGQSIGSAEVQTGQVLETEQGKAEMLLTPGVFMRLGDHSRLRMISPGLTDTRVELLQGRAMLEVTELMKENNIRVREAGATISIQKAGLYEFDADWPGVRVYEGKALVTRDDLHVELGKGRETALAGKLRVQKFDRKREDDLYAWSNVRSESLAEASMASVRTYFVNGGWYGPGWWYGAGWYWNPWYGMYSFIPGGGILYSPFGWGFYSPGYIAYAPAFVGRFGYGYHGRRYWGHRYVTPPVMRPSVPRGFSGGARGFGGFHGGAGGFHGGRR